MPEQPAKSVVEVQVADLKLKGFTESGLQQFSMTVQDYSSALLDRAVHLGEADKAPGMKAEIGHDHVRGAAFSIARSHGSPSRSNWSIAGQVCEYLATAVAGVGGGHLDKKEGIVAFAIGVSVAVILVVVRLAHRREE